jgi:hypothetical protein
MADPNVYELDFTKNTDPVVEAKFLPDVEGGEPVVIQFDVFGIIEKLDDLDANAPGATIANAVATATGQDATAPAPKKDHFFKDIRRILGQPTLSAYKCCCVLVGVQKAFQAAKVTQEMESLAAKAKEKAAAEAAAMGVVPGKK